MVWLLYGLWFSRNLGLWCFRVYRAERVADMSRQNIVDRDGNVRADDCVEVRLTGDGGKTNYVFAVSASGAKFDARNGDKKFNVGANDWAVWQDAGEKFWTVEMKLNLG